MWRPISDLRSCIPPPSTDITAHALLFHSNRFQNTTFHILFLSYNTTTTYHHGPTNSTLYLPSWPHQFHPLSNLLTTPSFMSSCPTRCQPGAAIRHVWLPSSPFLDTSVPLVALMPRSPYPPPQSHDTFQPP